MKDGRIPKWFLSVNLECDESKKIVNISNDDYINNFDDDDEPKTYNTEEPVEEKYNEQKIPIFGGNNDETSKDLDIDDI
jgi:hypothetical protein